MGMKIFVITACHGEYSDRTDWNVCAAYSKERAEVLVHKLRELSKFNDEFKKRLYNEFEVPYIESHKEIVAPHLNRPEPTPEFRLAISQCANAKGTSEDKANFKRLQTEHVKNCQVAAEERLRQYKVWNDAVRIMQTAKEEWKKLNYHIPFDFEEVAEYCQDSYDVRYDYNEINIL